MAKAKRKTNNRRPNGDDIGPIYRPPGPRAEYDTYALGPTTFELLCCALLASESHLDNVDLYSRPRQLQHGIDVIGDRKAGDGTEAVSCKCYRDIKKDDLASFVTDFLNHWDQIWKPKEVRRFVLAVTVDLRSQERQKEIEAQRRRLAKYKIKFDVWSKRVLSNKIMLNLGIRSSFYPDSIAALTNALESPPRQIEASLRAAGVDQIDRLQAAFADSVSGQLDEYAEKWRKGLVDEVDAALAKIREKKNSWKQLSLEVRARVLRMQALIAIKRKQTTKSKQLLDEADTLHERGGGRFRALLAHQTDGPKKALKILGEVATKEEGMLRAALLLESDEAKDAEAALRQWESQAKDDPEWRRLMACSALMTGRVSAALSHIEKAEKLGPDWKGIRRFAAMIRYANALSPVAARIDFTLPQPVHPDLVKRDDDSRLLLEQAFAEFRSLRDTEIDDDEKNELDVWMLASLANMDGRVEEAQALCGQLIDRPNPSVPAIFWALTRRYPFPVGATKKRLQRQIRSKAKSVDQLQALLACLYTEQDQAAARKLLSTYRSRFRSPTEKAVINSWETRLSASERPTKASARTEPFFVLEALIRRAATGGDWTAVESFLSDSGGRGDLTLAACEAYAAHDQWSFVIRHEELLLRDVENDAAVRLIAYARFNTDDYGGAVAILDQNAAAFAAHQLPDDLVRLRAYSMARAGDILKAKEAAASLARQTRKGSDRLLAAQLQIKSGDIASALPFIREAVQDGGWKPEEILPLVPRVFAEDPDLARRLMQGAIAQPLKPEEGGMALEWAFRLGMQSGAATIAGQIVSQQDTARPVLRSATLEEVIEFIKQRQESQSKLSTYYRRGEAPIHLIAKQINLNLARFWDQAFESRDSFGVLVRSANRSPEFFPSGFPQTPSLAIDITALLSADMLGLLDIIESSTIRLELPQSLLETLQYLETNVPHHQPTRVSTMEAVVGFATRRPEAVVPEGFVPINQSAAQAVFLLDSATDGGKLPRVSLGAIASELVSAGYATRAQVQEIKATDNSWQSDSVETEIASVQTILLSHNTIDSSIEAGLFAAIEKRFNVFIDREHVDRCIAEIAEARRRAEVAKRLQALRRRLSAGLATGRYAIAVPKTIAEDEDGNLANEVLAHPLIDLLRLDQTPGRLLWVDDRVVTSYIGANGNVIVSTFEVLALLRSIGSIQDDAYYALLIRMRDAKFDYLPVSPAEVLYWLRRADISDDAVVENPALSAIRRSFNRLLLNEKNLDLSNPPATRERAPELPSLIDAFRLARVCIESIWSEAELPIANKRQHSDWVWDSLRVEFFETVPANSQTSSKVELWRIAVVQMLMIGFTLDGKRSPAEPSLRNAYFSWLTQQLQDLRDGGSEDARKSIAGGLWQSFATILKELDDRADEEVKPADVRMLIERFVAATPVVIRDEIRTAIDFEQLVKPEFTTVVTIGDMQFVGDSFWAALGSAWNGGPENIETIKGDVFAVRRAEDAFSFEGGAAFRFVDNDLALLSTDPNARESHLRRYAAELAGDRITERVKDSLVREAQPHKRMSAARMLRNTTVAGREAILRGALKAKNPVSISNLVPAAASAQLEHLGLRDTGLDPIDWDKVAENLIASVGRDEAIRRWNGLPIALPLSMTKRKVKKADRAIDLRRPELNTPMGQLRAIELVRAGRVPSQANVSISGLVSNLAGSWEAQAAAFKSVLRWSERVWRRDAQWHSLPASKRLACIWSYADTILSIFISAGADAETLQERFESLNPIDFGHSYPLDALYEADVAAPRHVSSETLLLHGLNAALGESANAIDQSTRQLIARMLMQKNVGLRDFPRPGVFEDRRRGLNALSSYLSGTAKNWLETEILLGDVKVLSDEGRDKILQESLQILGEKPNDNVAMILVHLIGPQWIAARDMDRVNGAVLAIDKVDSIVGGDEFQYATALYEIAPWLSPSARAAIRQSIPRLARDCATHFRGPLFQSANDGESEKRAAALIELCFALNRSEPLAQANLALATSLRELVSAWPALAGRLRAVLARLLAGEPSEACVELWHTYVLLRAIA